MSGTLYEGDKYSTHCPVVDSVPGVLDINRQQSTTSRQRVCHCRLTWHLRSTQGPGDMDRFSERLAYKSRLQFCVLEKEETKRIMTEKHELWHKRNLSRYMKMRQKWTKRYDCPKQHWFYCYLVHFNATLFTVVKRQDDYEWLTRQEKNKDITDEKKWKQEEGREK